MPVTQLMGEGRRPQGVRLGVRIEFYDKVPRDGAPQHYVGAAFTEDGFTGSAVPRVGEAVSLVALLGGLQTGAGVWGRLKPWDGGPFLSVAAVEHYPLPTTLDGRLPDWWNRNWTAPGVYLVLHAETPHDQGYDATLTATLRTQGWTVDDKIGS